MLTRPRLTFSVPTSLNRYLLLSTLPALIYTGCGDSGSSKSDNSSTQAQNMNNSNTDVEEAIYTLIKSDQAHNENPDLSEELFSEYITANQNFSFELYRESAPSNQTNVMLSAWSVRQAFGLLLPGANEEGRSALSETLGFATDLDVALNSMNILNDELNDRQLPEENDQAPLILRSANSIWVAEGNELKADYLDLISEHLDAGIYEIDFKNRPDQASEAINAWVETQTEDRIKDLIPLNAITSNTKSILTNAVYFKAPWQTPFKEYFTQDGPFTTETGEEVMAALMKGEQYAAAAIVDGVQVLTLPFRGHLMAITFLMPTDGTLNELESELTAERWDELLNPRVDELRIVTLPKFKFETSIPNMSDYFMDQATRVLFEKPIIDQIFKNDPLTVSKVMHKSFIEINETGGEAAAATAIMTASPSVPEYGPEVVLDRAFLFAIHDQATGAILFFGKVGNPNQ